MKFNLPVQTRAASFEPSSVNADKRTADLVWSTGAAVQRSDFWTGRQWIEELSMEPAHIRMGRLNGGAPLLNSHASYDVRNIVGVVESASVDGKEGRATVRFSDRAEVEPIWKDVQAGIIRNISVGYAVYRMKDMSAEDAKVKTLRAVDWEPFELSIVAIPADAGAGFRGGPERFECEVEESAQPGAASRASSGQIDVLLAINKRKGK